MNNTFARIILDMGVNDGTSPEELKIAARRARQLHHPDRGGDHEKFVQIDAAVEFLQVNGGVTHVEISLKDAFGGCVVRLGDIDAYIKEGVVDGQLLDTAAGKVRVSITPTPNVDITWAKNPIMRDGQIDNSGLVKFKVHVPWLTLMTGGTIEIISPFGEKHFVRVPAGVLESGNEHVHARIVRGGYWSDNYAVRRADIHILFVPLIPAIGKIPVEDLEKIIAAANEELAAR